MQRRVILVGRHIPDIAQEEIEIISHENILWSTDVEDCDNQFWLLHQQAREASADILLQNVPGILAIVLMRYATLKSGTKSPRVGVVVSVPGERKAQVERGGLFEDPNAAEQAKVLIEHANGRAKVEIEYPTPEWSLTRLAVTVDPITEFKFSHIEWF